MAELAVAYLHILLYNVVVIFAQRGLIMYTDYPALYGKEHICYLVFCLITGLFVCIRSARTAITEAVQNRIIKCAAALLFLTIFCNRLVLVFCEGTINWLKLIPDSFCSASSYILSLSLLFGKRDNDILHFVWLPSLAGGLIATFYPDFIADYPSFFHPSTFLGILHHTMSSVIVMLLLIFRYMHITYKKWYCMMIGFAFYLLLGAFLIFVCHYENPFYMLAPAIPGTPLNVWVIAPIYLSVYALILCCIERVRKHTPAPV